jgi:hypothetical protein
MPESLVERAGVVFLGPVSLLDGAFSVIIPSVVGSPIPAPWEAAEAAQPGAGAAHFSKAASQSAVHRATATAQRAATGRRVLVARSVVAAAMGRKVLVAVATTYEVDKDMAVGEAVEPVHNRS